MFYRAVAAIAAVSLAGAALPVAAQTADTSAPAAPAAKPKPEKKICRREQVTGSIMGGHAVCHTKSEWADIDTANNNAAAASRDTRGAAGNGRNF